MYCKDCKWFDGNQEDCCGDCKHEHIIDISKCDKIPDVKGALYISDLELYKAVAYVHEEYGCIHFEKR